MDWIHPETKRQSTGLSVVKFFFVYLFLVTSAISASVLNVTHNDYEVLMEFKATANGHIKLISWAENSNPCSDGWYGIACKNGRVRRLVLESIQLTGSIEALASLQELRLLSLKDNFLNGSLPEMSNWRKLKLLFLSQNQFSGSIPETISFLTRLWRLDLSNNQLSGNISDAFNNLDRILTFRLENNNLSDSIPSLSLRNLQDFNVSGNQLTGAIPYSLSSFPVSSFEGNIELCGIPLLPCQTRQPTSSEPVNPLVVPSTPSSKPNAPSPANKSDKLSKGAVIAIVVGDFAVLSMVTVMVLLHYLKKYSGSATRKHLKMSQPEMLFFSPNKYSGQVADGDRGSLVFIDGVEQFDLEELLRASAEMLGKGSFGTTYKAVLEDRTVVAVKRLRDIYTLSRREFEQHMQVIGRLRHPNVVSLRAHYYARDEKLLVYDYLSNGSLFSLLHGNRGPGRVPLDWTTRVKIALGAAKGLAYIHHECRSIKIPHGNIKSSNILLDKNGNACISDFGLVLMATTAVVTSRLVGYRAPEQSETKKVTQRADVYSFGVLLLEILTGKAPKQSHSLQDDGVDLPKWVQSIVREEWTSEVFDLELLRYKNIEDELVTILQIAMACVNVSPELRPKLYQVVRMIENIGGDQSPQKDDSLDSSTQSPSVSEGTSR